jgi:hypothetical protein
MGHLLEAIAKNKKALELAVNIAKDVIGRVNLLLWRA